LEEFEGAGVFLEVGELGEPVIDVGPLEVAAAGAEQGARLGFNAGSKAEEHEEEPVFGADDGDFVGGYGAGEHGFFEGEAAEDVAEAEAGGVLGENLAEAFGVGFGSVKRGGEKLVGGEGFVAEGAGDEDFQFVYGA
jgi:hypothetical protein